MSNAKEIIRHIVGYAVGISLFVVLIPYLLWFAAAHLDPFRSIHFLHSCIRIAIATMLGAVGIVFVVWSNAALFFIGEGGPTDGFGIAISPRTKHLVTSGPYRYTRNPMVFGAVCCYLAWGIHLNSCVVLAIVIAAVPLFLLYLRTTEEKRLLRDFGNEFLEYKKNVPAFFPKFSFKKN
ncbi:MAG: isoprenylcysteine carboxylmethyltransferase family protein [Spirochaetes bacterium]|nr:isoprenylcysteine carboxylmethyltransferase family protein [Spirochaetota bacterium]